MKLAICNWDKYQHYHNRRPPWVKLYTNILDEYDTDGNLKKFRGLPDAAKLTFLMILPFASQYGGIIPNDDPKWLAAQLGIKKVDIEPLIKACYLRRCDHASNDASNDDSPVLSPDRDRDREKEREREREALFASCWQAFGKYGVEKRARKYWNMYRDQNDHAMIASAIPKYLECVAAGRTKKQFEGWINPEKRLWAMDWNTCLAELHRKNQRDAGRPVNNALKPWQRQNMTQEQIDAHNAKYGIVEDVR